MSDSKENADFTKSIIKRSIKQHIDDQMNLGITDKEEIYKSAMERFKIDRKTVRGIAREMRNEMCEKLKVLQSDADLCNIPDYGSDNKN